MTHAIHCTGLRRLCAAGLHTPLATSMTGAERRAPNGRLHTTRDGTAFPTTMRSTEKLVSSTLITSWKSATSTTAVRDAIASAALGTFCTPFEQTLPIPCMRGAVRRAENGYLHTTLESTDLPFRCSFSSSLRHGRANGIHRVC